MLKLAVFLRGVNVKGTRMKMDELKQSLELAGYKNVSTILASGNAVVYSDDDNLSIDKHKSKIQNVLSEYFDYEAYVVIKTKEQIESIINEASQHTIPEGYHHYIFLAEDESVANDLSAAYSKCSIAEQEKLIIGEYGIYWIVPKGNTLKSDFGSIALGNKSYKSRITSRTISTIEKIYIAIQ